MACVWSMCGKMSSLLSLASVCNSLFKKSKMQKKEETNTVTSGKCTAAVRDLGQNDSVEVDFPCQFSRR